MKKKLFIGVAALGLGLASFGAAPASAAKPDAPGAGGRCVSQGLQTLASLGATSSAARGTLDYAPFGSQEGGAGLIRLELMSPFSPSLSTVIGLHRSNPELFAWCD